jgi:hypothetical protein
VLEAVGVVQTVQLRVVVALAVEEQAQTHLVETPLLELQTPEVVVGVLAT